MKKLLAIVVLGLLFNQNAYSETGKMFLKCMYYSIPQLAIIDFDKKLFDANDYSRGVPENLRYPITSITDEKIKSDFIEKQTFRDGYRRMKVTITIDRLTGTITDSGKKIEDTRIDKSADYYVMKFNMKDCQKIEMKKKF